MALRTQRRKKRRRQKGKNCDALELDRGSVS